jgi:hypothetical protein
MQVIFSQRQIANVAGSGANDTVATVVTDPSYVAGTPSSGPGTTTPAQGRLLGGDYWIDVYPSQACFVTTSARGPSGFTVTLTPPAGQTLSEGTFDVVAYRL